MKQPFFIGGIDDVTVAKNSAFGAAAMFFFTFLFSMLYSLRRDQQVGTDREYELQQRFRNGTSYGEVPLQDYEPNEEFSDSRGIFT